MKRLYILGMLASVMMAGCAQTSSDKAIDANESTNQADVEAVELTPCDITIGGVKFDKAKNEQNGTIAVQNDTLKFVAGPQTDFFRSPDGTVVDNSPVIFTEIDNTKPFTFTAKVNPQFTAGGTYSAGVLYAYENGSHSQKVCFEQDEYGDHRVVTVRTIDTSDDNNHQSIPGNTIYMRLSSDGKTLGTYYSEDGKKWHMARLYKNDFPQTLLLGLSSQSPKANEHTCYFTEVSIVDRATSDFRNGRLAEE